MASNRPLVEATIVRDGATGVQVAYMVDGQRHTARLPSEDVYFFRTDGELASVGSEPGAVSAGDTVLVPEVASDRGQSVTTVKPTTYSGKVAGTRQTRRTAAKKRRTQRPR